MFIIALRLLSRLKLCWMAKAVPAWHEFSAWQLLFEIFDIFSFILIAHYNVMPTEWGGDFRVNLNVASDAPCTFQDGRLASMKVKLCTSIMPRR